MAHSLDDIVTRLRRLKPDLQNRYPIREMAVFGSYARGEQTDQSDVDVLVDADRGMTLLGLAALQSELRDALGVEVDVVTTNSLRPAVAARVLPERVVL